MGLRTGTVLLLKPRMVEDVEDGRVGVVRLEGRAEAVHRGDEGEGLSEVTE